MKDREATQLLLPLPYTMHVFSKSSPIQQPHLIHRHREPSAPEATPRWDPTRMEEVRAEPKRWLSYINRLRLDSFETCQCAIQKFTLIYRPASDSQAVLVDDIKKAVEGFQGDARSLEKTMKAITAAHDILCHELAKSRKGFDDRDNLWKNLQKVYGGIRESRKSITTMREKLNSIKADLQSAPNPWGQRREVRWKKTLQRLAKVFYALAVVLAGGTLIGLSTGIGFPIAGVLGAAAALATAAGQICASLAEGKKQGCIHEPISLHFILMHRFTNCRAKLL